MTVNGWDVRAEPGGPTHFCPVFESKEAAEKWAEGRFAVVRLLQTAPEPPVDNRLLEEPSTREETPAAKKRRAR